MTVAVLAQDIETAPMATDLRVSTYLLQDRLDLTQAEAAIVAHFLARPELAAVARMRGSSYQTVRNQFKSAMQKTGTHSQAELALKAERLLIGELATA